MDLSRYRKVLSFFAHPDDETLAAGGTLAKLAASGAEVHVAIPATGIHSRSNVLDEKTMARELEALRDDTRQAMGALGLEAGRLILGEYPDNEMDTFSLLHVIHWLEEVLERVQPDLILTHHLYCTNKDHRICHEAAVVATRPAPDRRVAILAAEVPSSTGYLRPARWEPNFHVELTAEQLAAKTAAMQAYRGEVRPDPHPRSVEVIEALAKVRGSEAGCAWAEAFMVVRGFG